MNAGEVLNAVMTGLWQTRPYEVAPAPGAPERTMWCVWHDSVIAIADQLLALDPMWDIDTYMTSVLSPTRTDTLAPARRA